MHTKSKSCPTCVIAQSRVGEVMVCPECGVVHVNLASVSVRFDLDAFAELSDMLSEAQTVLEKAQAWKRSNLRQEQTVFDTEATEHFH